VENKRTFKIVIAYDTFAAKSSSPLRLAFLSLRFSGAYFRPTCFRYCQYDVEAVSPQRWPCRKTGLIRVAPKNGGAVNKQIPISPRA
jgi:hypothetical protein